MRFATVVTSYLAAAGLSVVVACTQMPPDTVSSNEGATAEVTTNQQTVESSDATAVDTATDSSGKAESVEQQEPDDGSGIVDITFEDIDLPIDADMVFRPFMMTERAQELDGKRVRISGYMLADAELRGIKQFILLKNTECKFGPGGQADHLINVKVGVKNGAVYRTEPISIEGVISVNPYNGFDGNTWSIFDIACDHIESFKPRR